MHDKSEMKIHSIDILPLSCTENPWQIDVGETKIS